MTNKNQNTPTGNTEVFEATLTLRQEGMAGDVEAYLTFAPLLTELGTTGQPEAYERMAFLMQTYLYMTGVVDQNGDLLDAGDLDDIEIDVAEYSRLN